MVRIGESGRNTRRKPTSSLAYALFCFRKVLLGRPRLSLSIAVLGLFSVYFVLLQHFSASTRASSTSSATDVANNGSEDFMKGLPPSGNAAVHNPLADKLEDVLPEVFDGKEAMKHFKPRHRHISRSGKDKDAKQQKEYATEHHKEHRRQRLRRADDHDERIDLDKGGSTDVVSLPEADAARTEKGQCLTSLSQLTDAELHPQLSPRHLGVQPPQPAVTEDYSPSVTLVCCHTSAGALSLAVHSAWAPHGSQRFLDMIREKYFDNTSPIYRCSPDKKACQFGLVADPDISAKYLYKQTLEDDINWLPRNQTYPQARLIRRGYLIYAGYGSKSRSNHFMLILNNTQFGDGPDAIYDGEEGNETPWSVPFAELVGYESFRTLDNIFLGYEHGPNPMLLIHHGWNNYAKKKYPELDFIKDCSVVEEGLT